MYIKQNFVYFIVARYIYKINTVVIISNMAWKLYSIEVIYNVAENI